MIISPLNVINNTKIFVLRKLINPKFYFDKSSSPSPYMHPLHKLGLNVGIILIQKLISQVFHRTLSPATNLPDLNGFRFSSQHNLAGNEDPKSATIFFSHCGINSFVNFFRIWFIRTRHAGLGDHDWPIFQKIRKWSVLKKLESKSPRLAHRIIILPGGSSITRKSKVHTPKLEI